jgi:putative nucleotidyltransferase with HDIG domain
MAAPQSKSLSRYQAGYGFGVHDLGLDAYQWDPGALTARVNAIFASPAYAPPSLPQVALDVMTLSQRHDVDFKHIAELMQRDPVLARRLLRVANSAAYRGGTPIRTVRDAVQRLGLSALRDLLMAEALGMRVFRAPGGYSSSLEELRLHSTMTAHFTRLVCESTAIDGEYAFLCGLLHDIGFAAILLALGNVSRGETRPDLDLLWPVADEAHAGVGALVARLWGLPPDVVLVIERHGHVRIDGRMHPMVAAIQIAEELALANGGGLLPKLDDGVVLLDVDSFDVDQSALARAALRLDEPAISRLRTAAEKLADSIV